ncbi:hypothetical protein [Streptomyces sp. NRRL WC-3723]|uniref:hypothetical protein n=1 Tax=Streptomyces sp. NRRL WC-3723 TaxID=1519491 RepID=UPI0004C99AA1|nr:hypothetical protein [Streptomyces sp. NRRL WC-3723]KOV88428.1 hypothetical protein ADL02_16815 [Streptomyces sp. NRRL WC-3723]
MTLLELGERLVEVPQSGDAGLALVGLLASCPDGCPPLLELVLEVAPAPVEGGAGDPRLAGWRLDVPGAAGVICPASSRSMAARTRRSVWSRCR